MTKVLIIEDNAVNAQLLTAYLKDAGFEVLHASDGNTGIDLATSEASLAAILLDRIMPDMDGLEVLKALKMGERTWNIPVIMLTSALSPAQIEEAKFVGAADCLTKPYKKDLIVNAINAAMKKDRRG